MVAQWLEEIVPTTLALKNIPDDVYERLRAAAALHRRSLNSEAIVCLEEVLMPTRVNPADRLVRARKLRGELQGRELGVEDVDALKHEGRP